MKLSVLHDKKYGRPVLIGASILIWLIMLILFRFYGYEETWKLWRVPAVKPPFVDFRLIPGSAESFQKGFEPSVVNPFDPQKRIFNYPAFWRIFFYSGITQTDVIWISVLMISLFFAGIFLFPKDLSAVEAVGMLAVTISPATMLLVERGNVDLIVFFLCAMIVLAENYSAYLAFLLIIIGMIVKVFPFFGVTVLLQETRKRFLILFSACVILLIVFMYLTWDSIKAAWNLTMRGLEISYGTNVFFTRYEYLLMTFLKNVFSANIATLLLKLGPILAGFILLLVMATVGMRDQPEFGIDDQRHLSAFRMGASIYVGTFLLGNNWDYRLAFLVFVVPQLLCWYHTANQRQRFVITLCLIALYLSCWHFIFWYSPGIRSSVEYTVALFIFDELMNWILMAGLAYLLIVSMPAWLRNEIRGAFPKRIGKTSIQL